MYAYITNLTLPILSTLPRPNLTPPLTPSRTLTLIFTLPVHLNNLGGTLAIDEMRDAVARQPPVLWHDEVGDQSEDGDTGHDYGSVCARLLAAWS